MNNEQIGDGIFRCASFVDVIFLNKNCYPNGIEKYEVAMPEPIIIDEIPKISLLPQKTENFIAPQEKQEMSLSQQEFAKQFLLNK